LQKGADKNIKNNRNQTPVSIAERRPELREIFREKGVCEKLFFRPDITEKTFCSNINMLYFLLLHVLIILLTFIILLPFINNTIFSICYLSMSTLVFILYYSLSFSNPGKIANDQYNNVLDIVEEGRDVEQFCPYCLVPKKFTSVHCLICNICVDDFDHHCFWVGNCIGKNNYTFFFIFLIFILVNTLFNVFTTTFFLGIEFGTEKNENENSAFPGFYLGGADSFFYSKVARIVVSIGCLIICILFFIPLINLFRMQLKTCLEKRRIKKDEEEYERSQLREKLDEEVWEDLEYNETDSDIIKPQES